MLLSPRPTLKPRCSKPGTNPTIAGHRYRHSRQVEQSKPSPYIRKGYHPKSRQITRSRKANAPRIGWDRDDQEDGRRLASDPTISLPGEEPRRTPRLQRQEAFRAPPDWEDDAVDDAALYRLGILYDGDDENAHVRGSGFSLDAIIHSDPAYSFRPAKRAKKAHSPPPKEKDLDLSVDLPFTYLTDDSTTTRFLEPISDEMPTWTHGGHYLHLTRTNRDLAAPLATIHELFESSTLPHAPPPAANDFPDLIYDAEEDHEEYSEGGDWALVSDPDAGATSLDTRIDGVLDGMETANSIDGAWVFVAGDDT
ncbi:hypothetical protein NPX13_g5012 [Xylaria arbuscula]|uniref:Uncharacterized protein n=1 Tax=Xylaria arbuscula TaxID=114810 RepID=A0A9W8NF87_9PEZI|nr:hypothetical protein NPX13_g5012 [Xylaria arbuscula]